MEQQAIGEPTRLFYLDWIRVGAFALLILYHVGMFYVTWDWHVKSVHAGHAIEPLMMLTNPWRLTLLFLVSGAATRFMADKLPAGTFARRRSWRLLVPLLFAMLVIVPPQPYYEVVEKLGYRDGFATFYLRYVQADGGFCLPNGCLDLPTWNHLWFVAYLFIYTMFLAGLLAVARKPMLRLGPWLAERLTGWGLLLWPILYFAAIRLLLSPLFEITHGVVDDWYNHAMSFVAFLLGFLLAKERGFAAECARLRWPALILALAAYAVYAPYIWAYRAEDAVPPEALRAAMRFVFAVDQWAAIVAALGFGARHLNRDHPALRVLTEAVFPFYIVHQTIIVVAGHQLTGLRMPVGVEAILLLSITAAACWLAYAVARRVRWLRPLFGLGPARSRPLDRVPASA